MSEQRASGDQLATLATEVAELRDLFQRRLLEDKAKNRLYEELYVQLTLARGGLAEEVLAPLLRELLLLVDLVDGFKAASDDALASIRDELNEVLERRAVRRIPTHVRFDPSVHEAVEARVVDGMRAGTILSTVRPGYFFGERLLRAEHVVVAAEPPAGSPADGDHESARS